MIVLPFTTIDDALRACEHVRSVRNSGGVIVVPTETLYGLAADPASPGAVARIERMKARPPGMGLLVLCAGMEQVQQLVEVPERWSNELATIWPAALTVILKARGPYPAATQGTLAVRVPRHEPLRALLASVGPLTGTSANRHAGPTARTPNEVVLQLAEPPDLVLDGGDAPGGKPSTIIDLTLATPRLIRHGGWNPHGLWKTL